MSTRPRLRHRAANQGEGGLVAVIYALCALLLLSMGALAVDLGSMYQREAETQSQADLSALSAANQLGSSSVAATAHSNAVHAVANYLIDNSKLGQSGMTISTLEPKLTDGDLNNGEVTFPSQYSMTVTVPRAQVNFTLAGAMGKSHSSVTSSATVGVGTPGANALMPFFVVSAGCDWGTQSLTDPANGQHQSVVPSNLATPLTNASQTSNATLTGASPFQFDPGATGSLTLSGTHLSSVNRIGFYRTTPESPNAFEEDIAVNSNNGNVFNVPVPTNVTNYSGVWWIRTYTSTGNKGWSPLDQSLPIRIGDGPIQCGNQPSSGNFGTLKLPRTDPTSNWLPLNIATGLQPPLSLSVQTDSTEFPTCNTGDSTVVYTQTSGPGVTRLPGTNCVDTDTGLTATVTTQGMVTGSPARLTSAGTTTSMTGKNCAPNRLTGQRSLLSTSINNDVLSCFLANPDMSLSTIGSSSYNGPAVLNPAIYSSPRFCWVPVLPATPSGGGSGHYSIQAVRPCFITGEANDSTYNNQKFMDCPSNRGQSTACSNPDNGLTVPTQKVTTLRIFLFNAKALPAQGGNASPGVILDPGAPIVSFLTN